MSRSQGPDSVEWKVYIRKMATANYISEKGSDNDQLTISYRLNVYEKNIWKQSSLP